MATPNYGSIPQESLNEVTPGVQQPLGARADEICVRRTDVTSTKGTAPFLTSQATTSRGNNRDLAPGETAKARRGGMGEVEFKCLRQVGLAEIYDESDIAAQRFDIDMIEHWQQQAQLEADTATDHKFADVLLSTTDNLEFDATDDGNGEWDDPDTGTPEQDMVDMSELVPHCDTVIAGRKTVSALRKSPDLAGEIHMYSSEGVITADAVRGRIAEIFDIAVERVFLLTDWLYNAADGADEYEQGFIGEDVFWAGAGYDLQLFDPNHPKNRHSWSQRVDDSGKEQVGFQRFVDIKRQIRENAVTASNILS